MGEFVDQFYAEEPGQWWPSFDTTGLEGEPRLAKHSFSGRIYGVPVAVPL